MSRQLLLAAREQAEYSEPAVRAAALLHIARVLAPSDQAAAEQMLEAGIALARALPGRAGSLILGNAVYLAAAVSPRHALPLYAAHRGRDPFGGAIIGLVNAMAEHGHVDDAISYLNEPLRGDRFPLSFVNNLAKECRDDSTRLKLARVAIRGWRNNAPRGSDHERFDGISFAGFIARHWNLLPREEASRVLKEVVRWIRGVQTEPCKFPVTGNPGDPELSSETEYLLFQMLPALRSLEPELTESLFKKNPQLATAAKRFPLGMQSVREEASENSACEDVMMIGKCSGTGDDPPNARIIPVAEALANDFDAAFQEAFSRYARDSDPEDPNEAPKECWPSTHEFRNILFTAGRRQGMTAAKYLDRIPDPDLRLFAQIELCAVLAGLPQIGGTTVYHKPRARPAGVYCAAVLDEETVADIEGTSGPDGTRIRCPKCRWSPRAEDRWSCTCGHIWNTFDTGGVCPACQYQWQITMCPRCGEWSPHSEWYAQE